MSRSKDLKQKETAERLGITTRHLRNLVADGVIPKDGEGPNATHPWPESRDKYNAYLRAQERKKEPEDKDRKNLLQRKLAAEVRMAEIEVEEADGRLVPFQVHELRVGSICDRLRGVLMTVPSKFLSRIQVTRTDLEAQAVGEQIRDELLRALQGTSGEIEDEDPEPPPDVEDET